MKNLNTCPICRRAVAVGMAYCPHCGAALRAAASPAPRHPAPRPQAVLGESPAQPGQPLDYPLADQEHALRRLKAAWREMLVGRGQLVSLIGETGSGRSRLIRELARSLDQPAPGALWLVGQAQSYTTYFAYYLLAELLAPWARGSADGDVARRLADALDAVAIGGAPAEHERLTDLSLQIREAPDLAQIAPARLARALGPALRRVADGRPLVVVLEDLEWGDRLSTAVFDALLPPLLEGRTLVLCTHHADWSHEWRDVTRHYQLVLGPLPGEEGRRLVESVAGDAALSGQTIEALVARGNGNPLFLEQATLAVREQPLEVRERSATPPVPATLEEAIRARIGALPIEAREVLFAAAVIGQRFTYDAVAAVTGQPAELDAALQELAGRRLVQRWREYPEVTYRFAHGLIQEVAYGSLPHPEQQVLEARVADWLLSEAALGDGDSAQFIGELDRLAGPARRDAPAGAGDLAPAPGATDEPATAWPRAMQQGRRNALLARLVLSELSAARRASVVLCLQHGYSYSTAGEALGLSREEVQSHLYEARQLFRRLYEARNATYLPATEGAGEEPR